MAFVSGSRVNPPDRILVRGVNWLGDVIMTLPALYRLREAFPNASITVLTAPKLADVYKSQPVVDATLLAAPEATLQAQAAQIRAGNFDTGLIFTHSPRSAVPFWLARVPHRIGYGERGRAMLLTEAVRAPFAIKIHKRPLEEIKRLAARQDADPTYLGSRPAPAHHLRHYLHLVAAMGGDGTPLAPHLFVPDAELRAVEERFALPSSDSARPLFGLNPGAEYGLAKRWPPERFIAAAIALQRRLNCRWIITGGRADGELTTRIAQAIQAAADADNPRPTEAFSHQVVWNTAGQTSLPELFALLRLCSVVVANDTGPMHAAAAVGASVVVPFGSTAPEFSAPGLPGSDKHRLLIPNAACAPCFQRVCPIDFRCMHSISAAQVVEAVAGLHSSQARVPALR